MIDPRTAADQATQQIINQCVFNGGIDPESAKALAPTISGIVLAAITRCVATPSQGLNDK